MKQVEYADADWDMVIQPKGSLFDVNLKEVWKYRDLMLLFVKRDFIAQYKQTILGPIWHLVQPVLTTIMFLLIFGRIAKISTDGIHPILFYMSGITIWNYFTACLNNTSRTFIDNAGIFGKVYFPRLVLPLSVVISNIIKLGIQMGLLLLAMIYFHFNGYPMTLTYNWIYLPFIIVLIAFMGLGLGIIISSLTTKYRDFSVLLTFVVQLGMYATPIAYPMSFLQDKSFGWIIRLNPLSSIVEAFRYCLFNRGTFDAQGILYSVGFTIIVLFFGVLIFSKVERSFMDTV